MNAQFKISIIVPCFNEEESLVAFYQVLSKELSIYNEKEYIFVDDGSSDSTLSIIKQLKEKDNQVQYVQFARNYGHQYAVKAGIDLASGDCVVCIDADLQQPPALIHQMVEKWQEGYDVVYSVRMETENATFFKRTTSKIFYKLINRLIEHEIEEGAADFRLLDRKVVDIVSQFKEDNLFLRGLISYIGFKQIAVPYTAAKRFAGTSKYTLTKMLRFAANGITSFSVKPLRLSIYFGLAFAVLGFFYAMYVTYEAFWGEVEKGWPTVVILMLIIGGLILIMLGIIGEYIGKMFLEVKNRPTYIIRDTSIENNSRI